jgi:hypothetical protein
MLALQIHKLTHAPRNYTQAVRESGRKPDECCSPVAIPGFAIVELGKSCFAFRRGASIYSRIMIANRPRTRSININISTWRSAYNQILG